MLVPARQYLGCHVFRLLQEVAQTWRILEASAYLQAQGTPEPTLAAGARGCPFAIPRQRLREVWGKIAESNRLPR